MIESHGVIRYGLNRHREEFWTVRMLRPLDKRGRNHGHIPLVRKRRGTFTFQ